MKSRKATGSDSWIARKWTVHVLILTLLVLVPQPNRDTLKERQRYSDLVQVVVWCDM
jgi:hypothetical protein